MNEKENKEIHDYLYDGDKCWHDNWKWTMEMEGSYLCEKCQKLYLRRVENPDYFTDLNAIHEVEKRIVEEFGYFQYETELELEAAPDRRFAIFTAEQRANACLRVIREVE